ncbi:MAG: TonB family protein [bacterium]|nr:TonB family protein [bacterium]
MEGKCPQPNYPQQALQDSVKGKVVVGVHVDSCGLVKEWKVFQEKPEGKGFAKEVEKVIPHWEFLPPLQQDHSNLNSLLSTNESRQIVRYQFPNPYHFPD